LIVFLLFLGLYLQFWEALGASALQIDHEVKSENSEVKASAGGVIERYAFIDCVRGYAILLVITCHLTAAYANLPYLVHRFTTLGWHGVQLFFLGSAVTLMMSWRNEIRRNGSADVTAFFLRRFFRIAPAYYGAALFYFYFSPPGAAYSSGQAAAWLLFLNDWSPVLSQPSLGGWQVVPGGWSISAEFAFYAVFPLIALQVTNLRNAALLFVGVTVVTCIFNSVSQRWMAAAYDAEAIEYFMYFFAPNQAPVFALGILLYFGLDWLSFERHPAVRSYLRRYTVLMICVAGALFLSITYLPLPRWFSLDNHNPPALLQASLAFSLFVIALAVGHPVMFVNRPVAFVGKVSFSAYLIHFAIIDVMTVWFPSLSGLQSSGYWAILAFSLVCPLVVALTVAASALTYHLIEEPGIALGRSINGFRKRRMLTAKT
jgi:peptidoglycan/LPS O-acetylase OafA/YrhL